MCKVLYMKRYSRFGNKSDAPEALCPIWGGPLRETDDTGEVTALMLLLDQP